MIRVRPAIAEDRAYVISNWSASYRSAQDVSFVPMKTYAAMYRPVYEALYDQARVLVAHGDLGVLMGFIVCESHRYAVRRNRDVVYLDGYVIYIYTGEVFRRHGVASELLGAAGIPRTSRFGFAARTRMSGLLRDKIPHAIYDPMRARYNEVGTGDTDERTEAAGSAR